MDNTPDIKTALRKAYLLGQTYWQQADSEYTSQHRKADETQAKFEQLVTDTVAALTSPAKVGGDGLIEQHARDSAELRRLCAARDEARRTAEYWKANHIAGNAEIERLRKLLEVKVGGDERDAFEAWVAKEWPGLVVDRASLMGFYKGDDGARLDDMWAAWQASAALSADGGEGCTPADVKMLRFANHSLENVVDEYRTALGELVDQIEKFAEEHGEAAFETGRALRLLNGLPPAEKVPADGVNAELLEALEGVVRVADRKTDEFDRAREIIAKAKGA